jgi:hypothetical protein
VQGTIWATAHTTQFAQPGWQYLDAASGYLREKGSYVALRSKDRRNWSVILETIDAKHPQTVSFQIAGGLYSTVVHVWETNNFRTFERVATVIPVHHRFEYTFEPDSLYSLTTTTGQGMGTAQPPPSASFPLPYVDDFERTPLNHSPRYLSDQDGAFEVRPCLGRPGKCLEQVISTKPIPWGPLPDPFTLAGDSNWTDYSVAADVRLLSKAPAVVMGRIDSADVFRDDHARWPSGYVLRLQPDGVWDLLSVEYGKTAVTLASGTLKIDSDQWHRLELCFRGTQISALVDGISLTSIENSAHMHGLFALGSEWDRVQFDNVRVAPRLLDVVGPH